MNKTPIKFIYFDVGMVLDTYPQFADHGKNDTKKWEFDFFKGLVDFDRQLCLGDLTLTDLWRLVCGQSNDCPSDTCNPTSYVCQRHQARAEMHLLVDQLKKRYKVGLLTNMYPDLLYKLIEAGHVPPSTWFSVIIDSSSVHAVKPDRQIYEIATKQAGVKPEEIAFVDDKEENVIAARNYGWTAWQFDLNDPKKTMQEITDRLLK